MKHLITRLHKQRQRGVIFLALALVLLVAGSTVALSALNNRQSASLARDREVRYQMEQAKAALLAYAANYAKFWSDARGPGFFPCPDTDAPSVDPDGLPNYIADTGTGCTYGAAAIGRLPQMEDVNGTNFRFNNAFADIDQQFWYVVGPRYLYSDTTTNRRSYARTYWGPTAAFTYASNYWLRLDDDMETEYVAFIIAPGDELETQDRDSGPTSYANYIDGENGSGGYNFYTSYSSNPELFNDQILGITLDEYMTYVGLAVAREIKLRLEAYYLASAFTPKRYPPDSGAVDTTDTSCASVNTTFSNMFDGTTYGSNNVWLRDTSSGTSGERWSCPYGTYWNRDAAPDYDRGTLKINGCPGLSFRMVYGEDVEVVYSANYENTGKVCDDGA